MSAAARDVVHAFLKAMETKDFDAALPLVSETCRYHNLPMAPVVGRAAVRAVLEPFFAPTLENEFVIVREAVAGSVMFVERVDRHRLSDRWVELPVTGVFEVETGVITVWNEYFDLATLLKAWPELAAQLGAA